MSRAETRPFAYARPRRIDRRRFLGATAAIGSCLRGVPPAIAAGAAPPAEVDQYARWLAGMDESNGVDFDAPSFGTQRARYAEAEAHRWSTATPRLRTIQGWAASEFEAILPQPKKETVFYPFSGPDALHALALFGKAARFVLVGLEPVGPLPGALPSGVEGASARFASYFDRLNAAWADLHRLTFFRTRPMATDLHEIGVAALLISTIARMGGRLTLVRACASPAPSPSPGDPPYVDLQWTTSDGAEQRMQYFQLDLSNAGLKREAAWIGNLRALAPFVTFVKAGSYLLHEERFSYLRQVILEHSMAVVQDDSGIPVRYFEQGWALRLYGQYATPVAPFALRMQPALREAFERRGAARAGGPRSLPFAMGYHQAPGESHLIVAIKGQ